MRTPKFDIIRLIAAAGFFCLVAAATAVRAEKPSVRAGEAAEPEPIVHVGFDPGLPAAGPDVSVGTDVRPSESGPRPPVFPKFSPDNRAASFPGRGGVDAAGLRLRLPNVGAAYSLEFWFRNDRPTAAEPITAYLFSRDDDTGYDGDNLGIGGTAAGTKPGRLFFFDGDTSAIFNGETELAAGRWYHLALVRRGDAVAVYLNGQAKPEIEVTRPPTFPAAQSAFTLGVRSDGFGALLGQLDEVAVYDRALEPSDFGDRYVTVPAEATPATETTWRQRVRAEIATLPKPPAPPAGTAENPIDAFLADWWKRQSLPAPALSDDAAFVRRAHLDVVGLLPDNEAVRAFLDNPSPAKRAELVDRLLSDRLAYAEHWMTFWSDLLRNDETSYIAVTRHPVTQYLFRSLTENRPYDEFVAELLNPRDPAAAGFVKGIDWTFSSSVSDVPPMQAAQVSAQAFLGVNLKCASCHNHFDKEWRLDQSWGYASFFSDRNLQPHRCDKPRGEPAAPRFLFDGLGEVSPQSQPAERLAAVSVMVTRPKNPRFARAVVNRLFKALIGQGLIDATDDLDGRTAFHPELLDWLAHDFMAHDYDLKHTLRTIATSRLYQMRPADGPRFAGGSEKEPPFVGPRLRRMTAEQFLDAVCCVTGHWPQGPTLAADVPNPRLRHWRRKEPGKLATVLGRPNRELVVSQRPDDATMLQALELVNGDVLARYLSDGAKTLLESDLGKTAEAKQVADVLCLRALARPATPEEVAAAGELIGTPTQPAAGRQAGWEDLLWMLFMSPEFQYLN